MGVLASCHESSVPLTGPHWGLPPQVLEPWGGVVQAPVHVTTARRGITGGPGAVDQDASGLGVARLGHRPRSAWRTGGSVCGKQAPQFQPFPWTLNPRPVTHGRHQGDGHGPWHPTPRVSGLDHRVEPPRVHVLLPCRVETLAACAGCIAGTALGVTADGWRRGVTHHRRAPAPGGRAPLGRAGVAASVAEPPGLEAQLGVLAITAGLCTRPGERTPRVICHGGDLDGRASPRAGQAGHWHRGPTVGCEPVAGLLGQHRGGYHPAGVTWWAAIPVEPVATGAGCVAEAQRWSVRWPLPAAVITIPVAGAKGAHGGHLGALLWSHRGHRARIRVDLHAHEAWARWRQG
jgi:hypothetical protein